MIIFDSNGLIKFVEHLTVISTIHATVYYQLYATLQQVVFLNITLQQVEKDVTLQQILKGYTAATFSTKKNHLLHCTTTIFSEKAKTSVEFCSEVSLLV